MLQDLWYRFCKFLVQIAAMLYLRPRFFGVANIPKRGGVLVVCNHQSHLDPPLVGIGCPRSASYLARKTLFTNPIFGRLLVSINCIPIDREGVGLSGIKEALRRLKRGLPLVMFPEGTRSATGEIRRFLPGFTALAARSGVPILPVAIEGAFRAFPRSAKFPRRTAVHVRYGEPIPADVVRSMDEQELMAEVERRVRECHRKLLEHRELRRKSPLSLRERGRG